MTYCLQYEPDHTRIISAVVNDARNTIPETTNQVGSVIFAYIQTQTALVTKDVLFYRITTTNGNLAGYFGLRGTDGLVSTVLLQLRPAFQQFDTEILEFISTFISGRQYIQDQLF